MYQLNRLEETDIFFLAILGVKLLGENLIVSTFESVLSFAMTLREGSNFEGSGVLVPITDNSELTNIATEKWILIVLSDRYLIIKTNENQRISLPTNYLDGSGYGSLEAIFNKIIELEN